MPRLDHITVCGFKSIRALEDFELRRLNVLIGPNGAGKSNLLGLFRMLNRLASGRLQMFAKTEGGINTLFFGGLKQMSRIAVQLRFESSRYQYGFALEPAGDGLVFAEENMFPGMREYPEHLDSDAFSTVDGGTQWAAGHSEARLTDAGGGDFASYALPHMRGWRIHHFGDTGPTAPVRQAQAVRDNIALKSDGGNLAPYLRHLRERFPDHYRKIIEAVRLAAPFFDDFVYRKEVGEHIELEWRSTDDPEAVLGPWQLSDGTIRFICLTVLLLQPAERQPKLVLVDEPELGLHPFALTLLAEMLKDASHVQQVIVSTQSAGLVSEFAPEDVVVVERKEDASVFKRLDEEKLSDWLGDYELGDLWRMNIFGGRPTR